MSRVEIPISGTSILLSIETKDKYEPTENLAKHAEGVAKPFRCNIKEGLSKSTVDQK